MSRRAFGYLLLGLAAASAAVGVWRGSVRLFGTLDDHWLPSAVPASYRTEEAERQVDRRRQEVEAARAAGDPDGFQKAEGQLRSAEERRAKQAAKWERVVARSYKLEGLLGVGGLIVAGWLGRLGWRCLARGKPRPAEPSAAADPGRM